MTIVLSQLRTFTVVSVTSITVPSAPYFGIWIQSPTFSISLADSWMPDTKPRMLSLKMSMTMAAEAPSPVKRIVGDLSMRIETIRITQMKSAIPCAVCRSPLMGLFCQAGRAETIRNAA